MRAFFQDGSQFGVKIGYSYEEKPLGTAGPLAAIPALSSTFMVTNGDVLTNLDMGDLIAFHKENKGVATIATHHRQVKIDLGVIHTDGDHRIIGYQEKPTIDYSVSMGIYLFEPEVLEFIPIGEYLDIPDLVKLLIAAGEKVVAYPFDGYWQDLGRPDDYEQAILDFENMRSQFLVGEL